MELAEWLGVSRRMFLVTYWPAVFCSLGTECSPPIRSFIFLDQRPLADVCESACVGKSLSLYNPGKQWPLGS